MAQTFEPARNIPDLSGKAILATAGNAGLGKETVVQLSKHHPSHIYLGARSAAKAQAAIDEIRQLVPHCAPITVSSVAETWAAKDAYDFALLKTDAASISTWTRYGTSKLAYGHHSKALAVRYPQIRAIRINPGAVSTNLPSGPAASYPLLALLLRLLPRWTMKSVDEGAKAQL